MGSKSLKLFNTKTRCKEELVPLDGDTIRFYACGPTVYDFAHIGNFRTYVFEDLLRKTIKFLGMKITQVMNFTDVDDKTIKGATRDGVSLTEYTKTYKEAFLHDLETLNIEDVEYRPEATSYIPEMIEVVQKLLKDGYAYVGGDGSIYYSIRKFPDYGKLSHLPLEDLKSGASQRVDSDEYDKENIADFVLWKHHDPHRDTNIFWDSPFGPGRPGWHLECSTMAIRLLGDTIDLHAGGVDNIFPHHENEIAQSEAYTGKEFVRLWVHSEYLLVDNRKMSKSLGNFYTINDLLHKGYSGIHVRYMLLQTHYRMQLNFTMTGLDAAKASLERIHNFIRRLEDIGGDYYNPTLKEIGDNTLKTFTMSLADDLNISSALATIFDMVRDVNTIIDKGEIGKSNADEILALMKEMDTVLGILIPKTTEDAIPQELNDALAQRQQARKDKDWKRADELRDFIKNHGYVIEDISTRSRLKLI